MVNNNVKNQNTQDKNKRYKVGMNILWNLNFPVMFKPCFGLLAIYARRSIRSVGRCRGNCVRHAGYCAGSGKIRNIAIIAHVDHGKTTLVDKLLTQTGALSMNSASRVMDSIDLERERGITIMSKVTSLEYKDHLINVVDTPGHSDFGGEVERILGMVDGVCLLVCGSEGPMPQTKYVLGKALKNSLKPIVVINKVDRETSRIEEVENELLDMFINFNTSEDQLEYGPLYASAKDGWAVKDLSNPKESMLPLLDEIIEKIPAPRKSESSEFKMLVTQTEENQYFGKGCLGIVESGILKNGDEVKLISAHGKPDKMFSVNKITRKRGTESLELASCLPGEIVYVFGPTEALINDTICSPKVNEGLKYIEIDPPTISVLIYANDSPLAGTEGKHLTTNAISERLKSEASNNISIQVNQIDDVFEVKGRGEIQISVILEKMRRDGFEMSVSSPRVIYKTFADAVHEPIEEVTIEAKTDIIGQIMDKLAKRKGEMLSYTEEDSSTKIVYSVPTRGLLGLPSEIKANAGGNATLTHVFSGYKPFKGDLDMPKKGLVISTHSGVVTSFGLQILENRGVVFVKQGDKVYTGSIIGETFKGSELEVNPTKARQLSNVRSPTKEEYTKGPQYVNMPLERILTFITNDEVLEVTPKSLRIRKRILDPRERRSQKRNKNI